MMVQRRRTKLRIQSCWHLMPCFFPWDSPIRSSLFSSSLHPISRWEGGGRRSGPQRPFIVVSFGELVAIVVQLASFIYLLGFFGIDYEQNFISKGNAGSWDDFVGEAAFNAPPTTCGIAAEEEIVVKKPEVQLKEITLGDNEDGDIAAAVCNGSIPSYSLESSLGVCKRAASVRRSGLELMTGRSLEGLPLEGFDYQSILGQCCEMPVGYVQVPVGVAGPLLVNGFEYMVPMATTEGFLVVRDGVTRAPV